MSPILSTAGLIAAIVICLFIFIYVLLAVAINLGLAFIGGWMNEKIKIIKVLRPYVDSVNETTEAAERGVKPSPQANPVARTVANVPLTMQKVDKQVDQVSDRVANVVIEARARANQVGAVAKAFFLPGLVRREQLSARNVDVAKEIDPVSPGYQMRIAQQEASTVAKVSTAEDNEDTDRIAVVQRQKASTR
jgi:hypothetical protein